jgi:monothiol glutaredoxin
MMPKTRRPCSNAGGDGSTDIGVEQQWRRAVALLRWRSCSTTGGAIVTRQILDDSRVHPAIRARIADEGRAVIAEVEAAVAANAVVVVGMAWNPFPTKARKWLDAAGVAYKYVEYGNYLSQWRTRLPLKLWTGWTTFPMIFVDGQFIGGFNDLVKLDPATLKKGAGAASVHA